MRINPRTEEEVQSIGLLTPGKYDVEVLDAQDRISKSGNEMIEMQLRVWGSDGKICILTDYLLDAMAFKLRHFAEATGLIDKYNLGNLEAADCINKCAKAQITIQKGKEKEDGSGEKYRDKNVITDYFIHTGKAPSSSPPQNDDFLNDEVPF
ncbi:MAG: DUF669 domain-containing protein [Nitrospirae bacterium]|jgi:hypothetical protein|nr:MAG: DUF669 domain-containing protein [Nitrospirota bacterium]